VTAYLSHTPPQGHTEENPMLVRKAVVAASITTLMAGGLGLAAAAPASAAPSVTQVVTSQDVGNLTLLRNVDVVVVDLGDGQLINIEVQNLTLVALNNIVAQVLNNVNVNVEDINIDVDITRNVLIIDVL
jgi:hypothetical protein